MATMKKEQAFGKHMKDNYGHSKAHPLGCYNQKEQYKTSHFTDSAFKNHKKNSVAVGKYNINWTDHKPKNRTANMGKKPEKVEPWRIPKDKEPGPGSYPVEDVIRKTQWRKYDPHTMKASEVRECFTETAAKRKKFIPGIGSYKNEPAGHDVSVKGRAERNNPHS